MARIARPTLSIGLAVRNGRDVIFRCVESILGQHFGDFELIVSDNVSDDDTVLILEEFVRSDSRVHLTINEVNIGSHENMNRVLNLSQGVFFRWISSDDWLEPDCLSTCIDAIGYRDDAIGVTTDFTIHTADGSTRHEDFQGEYPTSSDPSRRFERMLWFFHAGDAKYDPIYGVFRRDVLLGTHRLRRSQFTDWLLCAELALTGPILHVHERVAHRTRSYEHVDPTAYRRRLDPAHASDLRSPVRRLGSELMELVRATNLTADQQRRCERAVRRFVLKETLRRERERAARMWRRLGR